VRATTLLLMLLLAGTGCGRHGPSEAEKRQHIGEVVVYKGAPFCCIYVGLETNETALFTTNFWRFASQHGIHKLKKHYMANMGPPPACESDHVAVWVHTTPTRDVTQRYELRDPFSNRRVSWLAALWQDAYWPTNACRITKDGRDVLAPITGTVHMASDDPNYPTQDFKLLSEALIACLQSNFPGRAVRTFSYGGEKP
jgi:hypothetical protein